LSDASTNLAESYPPHALRDYALLADGQRGALIGPRGDVVWLCVPRWESGAVFSSLIGGAGGYAVTPAGRYVWGGCYADGSLIWHSRWVTEDGIITCREALAYPGEPRRAVLLRQVIAEHHDARVRVLLAPSADYGAHPLHALAKDEHGVWTGRLGDLWLRWSGGAHARPRHRADHDDQAVVLELELTVRAGERHDLVLEIADHPLAQAPPDPARTWRSTERAWADGAPHLEHTIAGRDARQAYAVLRGLTGDGGGLVAAATTSLPERAQEGRNYDYRYVWIRDQCYAGQACAAGDEPLPLLDDAVRFVTARLLEDGPKLAPAYTVDGGPIPSQRTLDLPGYPGGFDQIGNQVGEQFQLDAFGEALLLLAAADRHGQLDAEGWQAARLAVEAIAARWREPDAGIWELSPRQWTHSQLICVAGLRAIGAAGGPRAWADECAALADTVLADTATRCLTPSGRWGRSERDSALDAALLLPPLRGALAADDPRTVRTLDAYRAALTEDHFAYRFRHDERPLAEAEGAFVLCGFVMALAERQQGHLVAANRWFERNRAACGPAGLYAEEYDVPQRQLRGNLPQAFAHALLLEAATRLADPSPPP
jgi:hypothetical protein